MQQTATEAVSALRPQDVVEQQDSPRADRCENKESGGKSKQSLPLAYDTGSLFH
jgi:hypothetical protein